MARLYYQSITFSDAATCPTTCPAGSAVTLTNNFVVNLNAIPAVAADYNDFYCGGQYAVATLSCTTSNVTIGPSGTGAVTYSEPVYNNPNPYTHGFVDWGCTSATVCPSGNTDYLPSATATDNGIFFHAPQGLNSPAGSATGVTNIGTATISGLLIQQLTIVTKGAN